MRMSDRDRGSLSSGARGQLGERPLDGRLRRDVVQEHAPRDGSHTGGAGFGFAYGCVRRSTVHEEEPSSSENSHDHAHDARVGGCRRAHVVVDADRSGNSVEIRFEDAAQLFVGLGEQQNAGARTHGRKTPGFHGEVKKDFHARGLQLARRRSTSRQGGQHGRGERRPPAGDAFDGRGIVAEIVDQDGDLRQRLSLLRQQDLRTRGRGDAGTRGRDGAGTRGGGDAGKRRGWWDRLARWASLEIEHDSEDEGEKSEEDRRRRDPGAPAQLIEMPIRIRCWFASRLTRLAPQAARLAGDAPLAISSPRVRIRSLPSPSPGKTITRSSGASPCPASSVPEGDR